MNNALDIFNKYSNNVFKDKIFTDEKGNLYTNCKLILNPDFGHIERIWEPFCYVEIAKERNSKIVLYLKHHYKELKNNRKTLFEILKIMGKAFQDKKFIDEEGTLYSKLVFEINKGYDLEEPPEPLFHIKAKIGKNKERSSEFLSMEKLQNLEEMNLPPMQSIGVSNKRI